MWALDNSGEDYFSASYCKKPKELFKLDKENPWFFSFVGLFLWQVPRLANSTQILLLSATLDLEELRDCFNL